MMFREPPRLPTGPSVDQPPVDIVVAVFNEARTITGKIANLLALDYPGDRLRFIVVDGGSSDDTCGHVAAWAARGRPRELSCDRRRAQDPAAQVGVQEVRAAIEREARPVGHERLQSHGGRHGVPAPKLEARDRADIPPGPVRRAMAAQAAAVQCRRDQARTVRVGEMSVGRAGQADSGSQVDGFSCGRSGEPPRRSRT